MPATDQPRRPVALVTGASSGIGASTARGLAAAGYITYAGARRPDGLGRLREAGCRPILLDVTDEAQRVAAVRAIELEHGALDLLVNNAGFGPLGALEEMSPDTARAIFDTNVLGLLRLCQLVLPSMRREGRGRIINVGSMGGEFTTPFGGVYHASKYAVEALSDALRLEAGLAGVSVVLVQPGPVRTRLAEDAIASIQPTAGSPYRLPLQRLAESSMRQMEAGYGVLQPDEVARTIVRAATARRPAARYKVGSIAHVLPLLRRLLPIRMWDGMWRRMLGVSTADGRKDPLPPPGLAAT